MRNGRGPLPSSCILLLERSFQTKLSSLGVFGGPPPPIPQDSYIFLPELRGLKDGRPFSVLSSLPFLSSSFSLLLSSSAFISLNGHD